MKRIICSLALALAVPLAAQAQTPLGDPQVSCQVSLAAESKPGTPVRTKVIFKYVAPDGDLYTVAAGTRGCSRFTEGGKEFVEVPVQTPGGIRIFGIAYAPEDLTGA